MPLIKVNTKPKNTSLWYKCKVEIENYTLNVALQDVLFKYLELRLAMKDKPIYGVGQWKGLLKKLASISTDITTQIKIVEQSIERGWGTFIELNPKYYHGNTFGEFSGMDCSQEEEEIRGYF